MIQILSAHDDGDRTSQGNLGGEVASALSTLGIRRLVLQPMDARLEYMRDLRVWLRENGWQITQVWSACITLTILCAVFVE